MLTRVTTWGRNGLVDWFIQRVTAVVLAAYLFVIMGFFFFHAEVTFVQWQSFSQQIWFQLFTILMWLSVVAHAWIGLWIVCTDYIKCASLRLATLGIIALLLLTYAVLGIVWVGL